MKLANKIAVITGGNSGIGLATAREFKANGAKVVIFGRNRTTLDQAAATLGDDVLAVQGDVRTLANIDRLFREASERFGKIVVLVANAGIAKFSPVESLSEALFDELCDIHFKGTFFTVQKALPFLHDGASVILVASTEAERQGRVGVDLLGREGSRALIGPVSVRRVTPKAYPSERTEPGNDRHAHHIA